MIKVILILIYLLFISNLIAAQSPVRLAAPNMRNILASELLRDLLRNHPDQWVRNELYSIINSGKIALSFNAIGKDSEMALSQLPYNGTWLVILGINPDFLLEKRFPDTGTDKRYKQLVIYHEAIHIQNHLSGLILIPQSEKVPDEKEANRIWDSEYAATRLEIEFAKRLGWNDLIDPVLRKTLGTIKEPIAHLDMLYQALILEHLPHLPKSDVFEKTWKKRYQDQRSRLLALK